MYMGPVSKAGRLGILARSQNLEVIILVTIVEGGLVIWRSNKSWIDCKYIESECTVIKFCTK
jgi:energy-converting hydrogenase Eha subunit C